jgi:hypothetical protein
VVADVHDVDETAQIELLGSELGHGCVVLGILVIDDETCGSKLPESVVRQDMELVWRQTRCMRRAAKRRRRSGGQTNTAPHERITRRSHNIAANTLKRPLSLSN